MAIASSPGRFSASNVSLQFLITWAWDLEGEGRVVNAPPWLDAQRFDVTATVPPPAPGEAPGERLKLMMQRLLEDRFRLSSHRDTRDLPLYALVVDGPAPKFALRRDPSERGRGSFSMPGAGRLAGTNATAATLARVLAAQIHRPVQDATGLTGTFDFTLEWEPDSAATPTPGRPALVTAVREQLGLRLDARRGPVDVLVIDRVERLPTAD